MRVRILVALGVLLGLLALPEGTISLDRIVDEFGLQRGSASSPGSPAIGNTITGAVTRVIDGDTFWLGQEDLRIRLWGLDAPETDERGGDAATGALTRLITRQSLTCRIRDIDRFDRLVAQCALPDGRDIAAAMIRSGVAQEYCRSSQNYYGTC